jgi:hypothetical protein
VNIPCKQKSIQAFKDAIKAKQAKRAAEDAALAKEERLYLEKTFQQEAADAEVSDMEIE